MIHPTRILVTGGAGFIGSRVAWALQGKEGVAITVLDDLSAGDLTRLDGIRDLRFIQGSILDDQGLEEAFSRPLDVVVHMAASFANQRSVDDPLHDLRTNAEGTLRVLRRSVASGVGLFVHASSSCVYGDAPGPLDEEASPLRPYTPYAASKLAAENLVSFYCRHHSLPSVVLRYFNCYGPDEKAGTHRGVVARFVDAALRDQPLTITGSGEESRQFLFVDDAARATALAVEAGSRLSGSVLNVASGRDTRVMDLARIIIRETGSLSDIETEPRRSWDLVARREASTRKALDLIGFQASTDLMDGIRRTVQHARGSLS